MADYGPVVLKEHRKYWNKISADASLAATDSLALPPKYEIYTSEGFAEASLAATDSLVLSPEYEIYANKNVAEASLAAADSLALSSDEEMYAEYSFLNIGKVKTRKRRKFAIFCFATFLLAGIIVLSLKLTKTKDPRQSILVNVGRPGQSIDSIEESVQGNMKDDNIFSTESEQLPRIYYLLESKVHNPAALLDTDTPEGKAFNILFDEMKAKKTTTLKSIGVDIERYALLVLYFGTVGKAWTNASGWSTPSDACKDWHGVACQDSLVIGISLDGNNLLGKIPEDFCLMSSLKFVRLSGNRAQLPSCFSRLSELQELDFERNTYAGELPSDLYAIPSLTSLKLSYNEFVGSIETLVPHAWRNEPIFPELRTLNLANNNLSGDIPESVLRRLRSLDKLILHGNPNLSGSLNEMCKGDGISQIDADCDRVLCKCCTSGEKCPSSLLSV